MNKFIATASIILLFFSACAKGPSGPALKDGGKWQDARALSYQYEKTKKRKAKIAVAEKGIAAADQCVSKTPEMAACYYWHAVLIGQYYRAKIIGYQEGLKQMIADSENVIKLDPSYEYGGAYRIIGQIYTDVPAGSLKRDSIIRDREKGLAYLKKAMEIAPNYPENQLLLADFYRKENEDELSAVFLANAKELLSKWKEHPDYAYWHKLAAKIEKKID